jgi:hypothetical protein
VAVALAAVPVLAYSAALLASGAPAFPSREDCARVATGDAPELEVVYGRLDELAPAEDLLARLTAVGFVGTELELDACGRWKVAYDRIESLSQGEALAEQARRAGFEARVELGG